MDSNWNYLFNNDWTLNKDIFTWNNILKVQLIINYWWSEEWFMKIIDRIDLLRKEIYETWFLYSEDNFRTDSFNDFDDWFKINLSFYIKVNEFLTYFSREEDLFIYDWVNLLNWSNKKSLWVLENKLCDFFLNKDNMKYSYEFEELVDYIYWKWETTFYDNWRFKSLINSINSKSKEIWLKNVFSRKWWKIINEYYKSI